MKRSVSIEKLRCHDWSKKHYPLVAWENSSTSEEHGKRLRIRRKPIQIVAQYGWIQICEDRETHVWPGSDVEHHGVDGTGC
jgi:hypothetical protein